MYKKGIEGFAYYLGINSLAEVAANSDRVCVLNILGGESRQVTPVSHAFSGGNVVFGTSPGRRGQVLATPKGDIPVYNNVREGLDDGLAFNCRRHLPAALRRARRRGRTDPRQSGPAQDRHHHRENIRARCPRNPRARPGQRHRHFRRQLPRALRIRGTACASAARSAATSRTKCCSRARSRCFPIRAVSPPRSRNISGPKAGARRR